MPSLAKQRLVIGLAVVLAFGAIFIAAAYSGDTEPDAVVFSGSPADGGGDRSADPDEPVPLTINPIEGWFPSAGEGSACAEEVGVDLIPGYGAILTINGVTIDEADTNVYQDIETRTLTAGGSQGRVTWGPEPDCPFGSILRPTNNQVSACIYRIVDGPATCRVTARPDTFDF